jgi:hypothetical protein
VQGAPHRFSLHLALFDPQAGGHAEQGEDHHGKSSNANPTEHSLQVAPDDR